MFEFHYLPSWAMASKKLKTLGASAPFFMNIQFESKSEMHLPFIRQLFYELKDEELNLLNLKSHLKAQLLECQFLAHESNYQHNAKEIEDQVILLNRKPTGRLILLTNSKNIHCAELVILRQFQHKGIGKEVFKQIISKAKAETKSVTLNVSKHNMAINFYKGLGFVITNQDDLNYNMRWIPSSLFLSMEKL